MRVNIDSRHVFTYALRAAPRMAEIWVKVVGPVTPFASATDAQSVWFLRKETRFTSLRGMTETLGLLHRPRWLVSSGVLALQTTTHRTSETEHWPGTLLPETPDGNAITT